MKHIIDDSFLSMLDERDISTEGALTGLFGGERLTKNYGSSLDFADYRAYTPGDDLRLIDRNIYARFGRLYLKLFYDERQLYHRIYIDASASMSDGEPSKGETALKIAAALSYLAVRANDRVALYLIRKDRVLPLSPAFSGVNGFYAAAEQMNKIRFKGEGDLAKALSCDPAPGRDDGISVILSDFMTEHYAEAVDRLLYNKRKVHLIRVLTEGEVSPSLHGRTFLRDSEAESEDDGRNFRTTINRSRIKAYIKAFEMHEKELKDYCARNNVGFFTVLTETPIAEILFGRAMEERLIL